MHFLHSGLGLFYLATKLHAAGSFAKQEKNIHWEKNIVSAQDPPAVAVLPRLASDASGPLSQCRLFPKSTTNFIRGNGDNKLNKLLYFANH